MHRTHIHFASEPKHLRADDWACVLLQARGQGRRSVPAQQQQGHLCRACLHNASCHVSPMPPRCGVQVDLGAAIKAGIPFCKAANNVILSEGPIPLAFVHRVMVRALARGGEGPPQALRGPAAGPRSLPASLVQAQLRDLPEGWQREIPGDRDRLLREEQ